MLVLNKAESQEDNQILYKEIANLIIRLDSLYSHVQIDINKTIYLEENPDKYPLDYNIVGKWLNNFDFHNHVIDNLNYKEISNYLSNRFIFNSSLKSDSTGEMDVSLPEPFNNITRQIFNSYNKGEISSDSLDYLNSLINLSSHMQLYNKKLNSNLNKIFVIHGIIDFEKYYLIYYHLLLDERSLNKPLIEIVFKD